MEKLKSVLITGGSRGIGAATVKLFSNNGWKVAFLYNMSNDRAKNVMDDTGAIGIQCDISKYEQVSQAVKTAKVYLGITSFDAVVCNAAISNIELFTETSLKHWDDMISVNINGVFYTLKETIPNMISNKKGKVVLISSMWGQVGASCEVAYSTTKAAIIGLTKSLSKEIGPSGINVNCIAPGIVDTEMNRHLSDMVKKELIEEIPMNRMGTGEDIAKAVYFLCTNQADYISGQVLGVNGALIV